LRYHQNDPQAALLDSLNQAIEDWLVPLCNAQGPDYPTEKILRSVEEDRYRIVSIELLARTLTVVPAT
jgi:hypothetical protein